MNCRGILLLGLGLMILLVVGCGRKAVPSTTVETKLEIRDSIITRIVEVPVPGESVTVTEYIECDSTTNKPKPKDIKASNGRANVGVKVSGDGKLTATGGCDSLKLQIEAKDRIIKHLRTESRKEVVIQYVHEPYLFDKIARVISVISLIVLFLKLRKFFI